MNTTSIHIKIEPQIKQEAQKIASELGLSLSAVTKALLKQFIRTKRLSVGEREEIPNAYLRRSLAQSERDIKEGRAVSFKTKDDALSFLDSLIANDRKHTA
jgi:addiction module RelB/DinJ family antitoxin